MATVENASLLSAGVGGGGDIPGHPSLLVPLHSNLSTPLGMAPHDNRTQPSEVTWWNMTSIDSNDSAVLINSSSANSSMLLGDCQASRDAQHVIFQMANLCLAVAFITPNTFEYFVLVLRGTTTLGSLLTLLWAGLISCGPDILGWYVVLLLVNAGHLGYALRMRWPVVLHPELEELYAKLFRPLQITRHQFRDLASIGQVKDLPNGATYALEGATQVAEKLSILLSGRLKVSCESLFLHTVLPNQFVDSIEYEALPADCEEEDTFQVTIRAIQDSRLLTWGAGDLHYHLSSHPHRRSALSNLLGKDVAHKLYQVQEMLLANPHYLRAFATRNSVVHVHHKLSQGGPNLNGLLRQMSPTDSAGTSHSSGSRVFHMSHPILKPLPLLAAKDYLKVPGRVSPSRRIVTPVGPYSPSQVSFETCV